METKKASSKLVDDKITDLPPKLRSAFEFATIKRKQSDGTYQVTSELGRGTYGVVMLIRNIKSKDVFAVKIMSKHPLSEVGALVACYRCLGLYENFSHIYVQLELAKEGMVFTFQQRFQKNSLPEHVAGFWFGQLLEGVQYIHQHGIIHRDLKNQNILLDERYNLKITDFGACGRLTGKYLRRSTYAGTPEFMPPECYKQNGTHAKPFDIWSCGVILYFMLDGKPPFHGKNYKRTPEFQEKLKNVQYTIPPNMSPSATHIITSILQKDETKRPTPTALLNHPFVKECYVSQATKRMRPNIKPSEWGEKPAAYNQSFPHIWFCPAKSPTNDDWQDVQEQSIDSAEASAWNKIKSSLVTLSRTLNISESNLSTPTSSSERSKMLYKVASILDKSSGALSQKQQLKPTGSSDVCPKNIKTVFDAQQKSFDEQYQRYQQQVARLGEYLDECRTVQSDLQKVLKESKVSSSTFSTFADKLVDITSCDEARLRTNSSCLATKKGQL